MDQLINWLATLKSNQVIRYLNGLNYLQLSYLFNRAGSVLSDYRPIYEQGINDWVNVNSEQIDGIESAIEGNMSVIDKALDSETEYFNVYKLGKCDARLTKLIDSETLKLPTYPDGVSVVTMDLIIQLLYTYDKVKDGQIQGLEPLIPDGTEEYQLTWYLQDLFHIEDIAQVSLAVKQQIYRIRLALQG